MAYALEHGDRELSGIVPRALSWTIFEPAQIVQEIRADSRYEIARRWRWKYISLEFEQRTYDFANAVWLARKPWWLMAF